MLYQRALRMETPVGMGLMHLSEDLICFADFLYHTICERTEKDSNNFLSK